MILSKGSEGMTQREVKNILLETEGRKVFAI
jgi:hypothetical protein